MPQTSHRVTKDDLAKRTKSRRRSERKPVTRYSTEDELYQMNRTRSDKTKPESRTLTRNDSNLTILLRKTSDQTLKKTPMIVEATEKENKISEEYKGTFKEANKTVEINVNDDIMEIVISTREGEENSSSLQHKATIHEAKEDSSEYEAKENVSENEAEEADETNTETGEDSETKTFDTEYTIETGAETTDAENTAVEEEDKVTEQDITL